MARTLTKGDLVSYIRSNLGEPLIRVDVTDTQIEDIIDDTIQKFTEYAYGDLEDTVIIEFNGKGTYDLPELITNIIELSKGNTNITNFNANYGAGFVPNIWSDQFFTGSVTGNIVNSIISISNNRSILEKYFGDGIAHNFNAMKAQIQLHEDYFGPAVLHYNYEYLADETDKIFNHEWIKEYAIAKTKFTWGNNIGKMDQVLIGGARLNYDRIISEAQQEIDRLHELLITKYCDPAPIMIG